MSLLASKPRMVGRSPDGVPPSPEVKVMPGTVRSASCSVSEPVRRITSLVTTDTVFGVSSSAPVSFSLRLTMERLGQGGEPPGLRAARAILARV